MKMKLFWNMFAWNTKVLNFHHQTFAVIHIVEYSLMPEDLFVSEYISLPYAM
jgi:hypothetical protein